MKHVPEVEDIIAAVEKEYDDDAESIITNERYNYITSVIRDSLVKARKEKLTTSDKIDRIVTNRWLALPIFAAVMWIVYYVSVSSPGRQTKRFPPVWKGCSGNSRYHRQRP